MLENLKENLLPKNEKLSIEIENININTNIVNSENLEWQNCKNLFKKIYNNQDKIQFNQYINDFYNKFGNVKWVLEKDNDLQDKCSQRKYISSAKIYAESNEKKLLAIGTNNSRISIYNLKNNINVIKSFEETDLDKNDDCFSNCVRSISWDKTGSFIVYSIRNCLYIYNVIEGKKENKFQGHKKEILCVDWSFFEKRIASSGCDGKVIIWDSKNFKQIFVLQEHRSPILSLIWYDKYRIASGDFNGKIIIWDTLFGISIKSFTSHILSVNSLALAKFPNNYKHLISCSSDGTIRFWDLQKLEELEQRRISLPLKNNTRKKLINVSCHVQRQLIFATTGKRLLMFNFDKKLLNTIEREEKSKRFFMIECFENDIPYVYCTFSSSILFWKINYFENNNIKLLSFKNEKYEKFEGFKNHPNGYFICLSSITSVSIWDLIENKWIKSISVNSYLKPKIIDWSGCGEYIAFVKQDNRIVIIKDPLNLNEDQKYYINNQDLGKNIVNICFATYEKQTYFISITDCNKFEIYDLPADIVQTFCEDNKDNINFKESQENSIEYNKHTLCFALSNSEENSTKLNMIVCEKNIANIYDLVDNYKKEKKIVLGTLVGHKNPIQSCSWLYNNELIITAARIGVRFWDSKKYCQIRRINFPNENPYIYSIPKTNLFISVQQNKEIFFWNANTGSLIHKINTFDKITRISFLKNRLLFLGKGLKNRIQLIYLLDFETYSFFYQQIHQIERNKILNKITNEISEENFNKLMNEYPKNEIFPFVHSAFHFFASDFNNLKKLIYLCEKYNLYPEISTVKDIFGNTPLDYAEQKNNESTIALLINFYLSFPKKSEFYYLREVFNINILTKLLQYENLSYYVVKIIENRYIRIREKINEIEWKSKYKVFKFISDEINFNQIQKKNLDIFKKVDSNFIQIVKPIVHFLDIENILELSSDENSVMLDYIAFFDSDHPIFNCQPFQMLIDFKWDNLIKRYFLLDCFWYFLLMITYTLNALFITNIAENNKCKKNKFTKECYFYGIFNCFCLIQFLYFLYIQIKKIRVIGFKNYFQSFWRLLLFIIYLFGTIIVSYYLFSLLGDYTNEKVLKYLSAVYLYIIWSGVLDIFRGFQETSFLIRVIIQSFFDIRYFLIILFIIVFASDYNKNSSIALEALQYLSLGDFDKYGELNTKIPITKDIIFYLSSFLITIVLLNLLIAIIGESFSKVMSQQRSTIIFGKTKIIWEYEIMLSKKKREELQKKIKKYFYVLSLQEKEED